MRCEGVWSHIPKAFLTHRFKINRTLLARWSFPVKKSQKGLNFLAWVIILCGLGTLAVAMWWPVVRELTTVEPGEVRLAQTDMLDIVYLADGRALAGRVACIADAKLTLHDARDASMLSPGAEECEPGGEISFDMSEVVQVMLHGRYTSDMPLLPRVYLVDGSVLAASPDKLEEGMLTVRLNGPVRENSRASGQTIGLHMRDVAGLSFATWRNPFRAPAGEDVLVLRDGSRITGAVSEISRSRMAVFKPQGGEPEYVECRMLQTVTFGARSARAHEQESGLMCVVGVADGSRLKGALVALDDKALVLISPLLGEVSIARSAVERITFGKWELRDEFPIVLHRDGQTVLAVASYDGVIYVPEYPGLALQAGTRASATPSGTILMADESAGSVYEIDRAGEVVWEYPKRSLGERDESEETAEDGLEKPTAAVRLPDGNTLICDYGRGRVIEVSREGKIVWSVSAKAAGPMNCYRLKCGRTLIAQNRLARVVEVCASGAVVWKAEGLDNIVDARRQRDGNTLVLYGAEGLRLRKMTAGGKTLWEANDFAYPAYILTEDDDRVVVCEIDRRRLTILDNMGERKRVVHLR